MAGVRGAGRRLGPAGAGRRAAGPPRGARALRRGDPPAGARREAGRTVPVGTGGAGGEGVRPDHDARVDGRQRAGRELVAAGTLARRRPHRFLGDRSGGHVGHHAARHLHHAVPGRSGRRALPHPRRHGSGAGDAGRAAPRGRAPPGVAAPGAPSARGRLVRDGVRRRRDTGRGRSCRAVPAVHHAPRRGHRRRRVRRQTPEGDPHVGDGDEREGVPAVRRAVPGVRVERQLRAGRAEVRQLGQRAGATGSRRAADDLHRREDRRRLPDRRAARGRAGSGGGRRADVPGHVPAGDPRVVQRPVVAGFVGGRPVGERVVRRVPARAVDQLLRLPRAAARRRCTSRASTRPRTARAT